MTLPEPRLAQKYESHQKIHTPSEQTIFALYKMYTWVMTIENTTKNELERATNLLHDLAGEDIDAIDIKSVEADEAPFLARVVSKLSPIVGNLMEQRIASLLDDNASPGFGWERQDPGFPDAVLKDAAQDEILAGYEIKAWYVLSTEITGRFRESLNLLAGKNINVVIVAWCMSNMIFGKPKVLGTLVVSAEELATSRDSHYNNPPYYLTIEPNDTSDRTANLQQSNVNGYRLQESISDSDELKKALERTYTTAPPSSNQAQIEAADLMRRLEYRIDTNFAKIDRVENPDVEKFKTRIMNSRFLNKSFLEWKRLFSDLGSADDKKSNKRKEAEKTIQSLYADMLTSDVTTDVSVETQDAH